MRLEKIQETKKGIRRTDFSNLLPGLHLLAAADDIACLCATTGFIDGNNKPADITVKLVALAFFGRFRLGGFRWCFCCLCGGFGCCRSRLGRRFRCCFSCRLLHRLWRCFCALRLCRFSSLGLCGHCRRCFCFRCRLCHFLITPLPVLFLSCSVRLNPMSWSVRVSASRFPYAHSSNIFYSGASLSILMRVAPFTLLSAGSLDTTDQIHLTRGYGLRVALDTDSMRFISSLGGSRDSRQRLPLRRPYQRIPLRPVRPRL